ncbi:hypothetical protein INS49_015164 [Diaporthe citri]|uniref:uncharacterized protein n=1 Tax=Diaporthe citri TaxID=83186 RepID=UPI001C7FEA25|nr:uncharacterized protein INS49_015164 [Diaporthe citri]KAG6357286.1 hypothetical protein INS49_015164 [Diaporthe citri]
MAAENPTAVVECQIPSGPAPPSATARLIDFKETNLGLYEDFFAMVIDDLFTPSECAALLSVVQPAGNSKPQWPPATVTAHNGTRFVDLASRDCGRIIHESQTLADALLGRILPHMPPAVASLTNAPGITGQAAVVNMETWKIARLDSALRFLRYEPGQYFSPHCDGHYVGKGGRAEKSFLTVHLYLNGGGQGGGEEIEGGATRFGIDFENPKEDKLDIDPKQGSVLIFQQRDMYHEGVEVRKGTKYTLRTDVIYEKV